MSNEQENELSDIQKYLEVVEEKILSSTFNNPRFTTYIDFLIENDFSVRKVAGSVGRLRTAIRKGITTPAGRRVATRVAAASQLEGQRALQVGQRALEEAQASTSQKVTGVETKVRNKVDDIERTIN
jgi:hypothetical protein